MKNYYKILQVKDFAEIDEIKKSFRKLALIYHPDKHYGKSDYEVIFKEILNAYEVLTDLQKKREFDIRLAQNFLQPKFTEKKSQPRQTESNVKYSEKRRESSIPVSIIVIIVFLLIYLLASNNSTNKSTTGNTKADKELDKESSSRKPKTGEINFTN